MVMDSFTLTQITGNLTTSYAIGAMGGLIFAGAICVIACKVYSSIAGHWGKMLDAEAQKYMLKIDMAKNEMYRDNLKTGLFAGYINKIALEDGIELKFRPVDVPESIEDSIRTQMKNEILEV